MTTEPARRAGPAAAAPGADRPPDLRRPGITKQFLDGLVAALVIFASWHPLRAIAGALLFGGAIALQLQLQARNAPLSPFVLDMLPYLLTLLVLLVWGRKRQYQAPEGLWEVFQGTN
jgi:uncharacterized RDD family membrane protein YckC